MRIHSCSVFGCVVAGVVWLAVSASSVWGADWVTLSDSLGSESWQQPTGAWYIAGDARPVPANEKRLEGVAGTGVLINGPTGRTTNLTTKDSFGDCEFSCEFLIPKGSNAGVKFEGLYELQIFDSYGVAKPTGADCGGIYPKATLLPRYHHLDEGIPPACNASRPPGEWQTLEATFHAPRFDAEGNKVANARLSRVVLNGQVIHQDQELRYPTGHAYTRKEVAEGPILLQADHGPVAFRNVRVRSLSEPRAE